MQYAFARLLAICFVVAGLHAGPADARRVALIIGNADYRIGPLQNPVNDASAVAEVFRALGFDKVLLKANLGIEQFRAALLEMSREASGADVGVVYFAGHGIESNGKNFLIPVDANLARAGDLSLEAITLDSVLDQLSGVAKLKLVILDACRNNLFPLADAKRSVTRGLFRIEPEDNTLVVYAAKAGTTADDGVGRRHSPFTEALLKHLVTPGLEISFVFRRVRDDVVRATSHVQQPHVYGTLGAKEFYLRPPMTVPPAPVPAPPRLRVTPEPGVLSPSRAASPLSAAQERALRPKDSFKECDSCPEVVALPSGTFAMGSAAGDKKGKKNEEPEHTVTIPRNFGVGKFETTVREYLVFLNESLKDGRFNERWIARAPKEASSSILQDTLGADFTARAEHYNRPVTFVSWYGAEAYVGWLSAKTGAEYRLLSEAEWEYAARAGSRAAYHFGDDARQLCNYANIADISGQKEHRWRLVTNCDDGFASMATVGRLQPSSFGLYDMLGNAAEWVADCWHPTYDNAPVDGSAWTNTGDCNLRIVRGGAYHNLSHAVRSATRYGNELYTKFSTIGFRVARTLRQ